MYTGEHTTSVTQSNTKRCIQAFLKTREQKQVQRFSQRYSQRSIDHYSGGFAIESKALDKPISNSFEDINSQEFISPEDVDNQNDFNYSQKLFHISDGNLYSIFSPIQGRSYGMKPSFLRKQKYTVQECHSRGRKNLRKGLKFHNFLPSESVTSEKSNGVLRAKWKVHSECRLKEEHGTKQITISNWSQNVQNSSENPPQSNSNSQIQYSIKQDNKLKLGVTLECNPKTVTDKKCHNDSYDFKPNTQNTDSPENESQFMESNSDDSEFKRPNLIKSHNSKKGSLKFVLNSLLDKPSMVENPTCDLPAAHTRSSMKHRRKPVQTRRVVPYTKYLSIMEEDESSPLDLSSKCSDEKYPIAFEETSNELRRHLTNCDYVASANDKNVFKSENYNSSLNSKLNTTANNDVLGNSSALAHLLQNQIPSPLVLLTSPIINYKSPNPETNFKSPVKAEVTDGKYNFNINKNHNKNQYPPLHMNPGPSYSNNMQYAVHKSFIKNSQSSKSRRRSQRSVIKKNLEDTFRQNGFLVKTKQVSDGEATFCKFRQLRKYTRYYLKSWQQHLPDEVNKMWKGFLPPKTVLPPVSEAPETMNGPQ